MKGKQQIGLSSINSDKGVFTLAHVGIEKILAWNAGIQKILAWNAGIQKTRLELGRT